MWLGESCVQRGHLCEKKFLQNLRRNLAIHLATAWVWRWWKKKKKPVKSETNKEQCSANEQNKDKQKLFKDQILWSNKTTNQYGIPVPQVWVPESDLNKSITLKPLDVQRPVKALQGWTMRITWIIQQVFRTWVLFKAFEFSIHFDRAASEAEMSEHLIFTLLNKANNFPKICRCSYVKSISEYSLKLESFI